MNLEKAVKNFIDDLKLEVIANEEYVQHQSTISHQHYSIGQSAVTINKETKTIFIRCDNDTMYARGVNHSARAWNIGGWKINMRFKHAENNLSCAGYCHIAYKMRQRMIKWSLGDPDVKPKSDLDNWNGLLSDWAAAKRRNVEAGIEK